HASLSAPILARPEPHRDAVQQVEGVFAQGGGTNNSSPAPPNWKVRLQPNRPRILQLFQARRLRVNSTGICSRSMKAHPIDQHHGPTFFGAAGGDKSKGSNVCL